MGMVIEKICQRNRTTFHWRQSTILPSNFLFGSDERREGVVVVSIDSKNESVIANNTLLLQKEDSIRRIDAYNEVGKLVQIGQMKPISEYDFKYVQPDTDEYKILDAANDIDGIIDKCKKN